MTMTLLLVFAVISILFSLLLAGISKGRTWAISPLLLFVIVSILFINAGFIAYYLQYSHKPWAIQALLSVSLGLLMVGLGGFIGSHYLHLPEVWIDIARKPIKSNLSHGNATAISFIIFSIVLLYFYLLGYIPLFKGIGAFLSQGFRPGLLNTPRIEADNYINPSARYIPMQGFMEALRYFGLPIVCVWFIHFFRNRIKRMISLIMALTSIFLIILTGQRWPLMYLIVTLIFYWSWSYSDAKKLKRTLAGVTCMSFLMAVILTALLGRTLQENLSVSEMIVFGFSDLLKRIFFGNVNGPFLSYEIFPDREIWLYGWSWVQNLMAYLPGPLPSFPVTFYQLITGDSAGFTIPPDFYTEAFINFGFPGVMVISFLWGIGLALFQNLIGKKNKALVSISILSLISTQIVFSTISGSSFILGGIFVSAFIIGVIHLLQFFFNEESAMPAQERYVESKTGYRPSILSIEPEKE